MQTYTITFNAAGVPLLSSRYGDGVTPELEPGEVVCTQEQFANRNAWKLVNGAIVADPAGAQAAAISAAIASLGAMLTAKESAGVSFTPTGVATAILFPSDDKAQAKYTSAWNALTATPVLAADGDTYIAADGTPYALSMTDARALITKALNYVRACFAHYSTLHAAVLANPSADITQGWPSNT